MTKDKMNLTWTTYDPDVDAAHIHLTEDSVPVANTLDYETNTAMINIDVDSLGQPIGIEIIGFKDLVKEVMG